MKQEFDPMCMQGKVAIAMVLGLAVIDSGTRSLAQKPVFEDDRDVSEVFREHGWLKTEKLLENSYMLANDNVAVLVDVVKPRIMTFFVDGKFGTWRQLLYDTPWNAAMSGSVWGIVPSYLRKVDGKMIQFLPIMGGNAVTEPHEIRFDPETRLLELTGLTFFDGKGAVSATKGNWRIGVEGDTLAIEVDYPEEADEMQLLSHWYPEYTSCQGKNQQPVALAYSKEAMCKTTGAATLSDAKGRMPQLTIDPGANDMVYIRTQRDTARGGAYQLHAMCVGTQRHQKVTFALTPNPVTLRVNPQINADVPQRVAVFAREKPTLEADGKPADASFEETKPGQWDGYIVLADGEHHLKARVGAEVSTRRLFALAEPTEKLIRVADCLLTMQWKTSALDGLMPFGYWIETLKPKLQIPGLDSEAVCGSYMIRSVHVLAAAAVLTGDDKYADALYKMVEAHVRVSHKYEDGSLMPPPDLQEDGSLVPGCAGWPRPMNQIEAVQALVPAYRLYRMRGEKERADQCLEWACRFAKTLIGMQRPDGSLLERYRFGTFAPGDIDRPFPIASGWELLDLADVLHERGLRFVDVGPEELRGIVRRQIDYSRGLPKSAFKMLWGSEAMPNSCSWLVGAAVSHWLTVRSYPEIVKDEERLAMEAAKSAVYMTALYPDLAEFYMIQADVSTGFHSLMGKGAMDDYQTTYLGLLMHKMTKDRLGVLIARYGMGSRLTTSIFENGAVCTTETNVPGLHKKDTEVSYTAVNDASIGYTGFQYATESKILDHAGQR